MSADDTAAWANLMREKLEALSPSDIAGALLDDLSDTWVEALESAVVAKLSEAQA